MDTESLWGIHAGKTGDADSLFKKHKLIGLGWSELPDLSKLPASRDAFKELYSATYPDSKAGAVPVNAGQLYRFVHELAVGDLVAYPSKHDHQVHIAKVTGPYVYSTKFDTNYTHRRSVEWMKDFPRANFSQGALRELGSAMSFFAIRNYSDEYFALLEGLQPADTVDDDATVAAVSEDIEQSTRDFIIKRLSTELKGHPFEHFVAHLLSTMGYRTRVTKKSGDGGVDVIAHKDELGFEPPIIKVQVKSGNTQVGSPEVNALYGNVAPSEFGLFVTLSTFSGPAKQFANSKSNLRLVDGSALVELVLEHYEAFDSRYKGLLPLRRAYIPEAVDKSDE